MSNTDKEQFIEIFSEHMGIVIKIARAYTHTRQDLEDLVNDIALELWKSLPGFRGDSKISSWIYRVALNTAMNSKKKDLQNAKLRDELQKTGFSELIPSESDERTVLLYDCIEELSELNRALIILYLDGNSYEEMARITGMSKSNVGTRISRIREQLRQIMELKKR